MNGNLKIESNFLQILVKAEPEASSCYHSCLTLYDRRAATECFIELCYSSRGMKTSKTHHMKQKLSIPLALNVNEYTDLAVLKPINNNVDNVEVSRGHVLHMQGQVWNTWNRKITAIQAERRKRIWAQSLSACIAFKCSGVPAGPMKDVGAIAKCHDREKWQ